MSRRATKGPLAASAWTILALLVVLHNDFWLWHDATRWLGLPAGLTYHLVFCLLTAAALVFLVRVAWPAYDHDDA